MKMILSGAAARLSGLALSAALFWGTAAQAQVTISPLVIEAEANRGQAQGMINVTNNGSEPFRARVYAEPFTYSRDAGFQTLPSDAHDLTPYLQFSPRELVVPPGVTRRVRLIGRFPPNQASGEYRAVVFTENLNETISTNNSNVSVITRIGVTVYVRQGEVSPNLTVESANWNPEQNQIQLLVRNAGQASTRPSVSWTLKQGETVVKTGNLEATGIVAQSDRNFLLNYAPEGQPAPAAGEYQLSGELAWGEGNNKSTVPFSINLTIPAATAASTR